LPVSESTVLFRLAKRIKQLRREHDWTQEEFAERASIQRSYLADLERGGRNPSVRTLIKMANAFRVSLKDLFED
jgi:transcriptional regulator with XRE-family HTH domain